MTRLTQVGVFDDSGAHIYELVVGETDGCWFLTAGDHLMVGPDEPTILATYDSLASALADMRARGGVRFVDHSDEVAEAQP